ncbi:unnamed protein product [Protopolystoma xenopodis]|uniref:Secreted protein n=1 Tax=Protopolystoma xenopodis TaxID=117903 RepID=A0A3S5CQL2_9PLAT|nr:unnamed protein product [Protopolystoma xenopodis]
MFWWAFLSELLSQSMRVQVCVCPCLFASVIMSTCGCVSLALQFNAGVATRGRASSSRRSSSVELICKANEDGQRDQVRVSGAGETGCLAITATCTSSPVMAAQMVTTRAC